MPPPQPPPVPEQLSKTIETLYRLESGRVLATLVRLLGDLDLAEEAMHEAFAAALESWPRTGVPDKPRPWLISTARFHTKQIATDETLEYFTRLMRDVDLQVFGRKTYQLMVPYWPEVLKDQSATKADKEFARAFDSINKIVFSRSLDSAEDSNTTIVRTNLREEILKLKQEHGKNILVGGVDIPSQLIELGLVDEYIFVVGPIVAGEGRRLLEGVSLRERLQLKLVESKFFKSGCVALHYVKQ
ncbi:MAG TPA: dihydrofolate reductase family protein [Candidatus Angelobacter sp.]